LVEQLTNKLSARIWISYSQGSNPGGDKISKFVLKLS
jgi:hypothetical protein